MERSGVKLGVAPSQADDCKVLHHRSFLRERLQVGEGSLLSASREHREGAEGGGLCHVSSRTGGEDISCKSTITPSQLQFWTFNSFGLLERSVTR